MTTIILANNPLEGPRPLPGKDAGCEHMLTQDQHMHYFACLDTAAAHGFAYAGTLQTRTLKFFRRNASGQIQAIYVTLAPRGRNQSINVVRSFPLQEIDYSRPIPLILSDAQIEEIRSIGFLESEALGFDGVSTQMHGTQLDIYTPIWHVTAIFSRCLNHLDKFNLAIST